LSDSSDYFHALSENTPLNRLRSWIYTPFTGFGVFKIGSGKIRPKCRLSHFSHPKSPRFLRLFPIPLRLGDEGEIARREKVKPYLSKEMDFRIAASTRRGLAAALKEPMALGPVGA
jgi:hypothetical protein